MENREMKYPRQVMRIGRADKILGANQYFYANEDTPMAMHSGYSKAELSILTIEEKRSVVANIPANDLPLLMEKTEKGAQIMISKVRDKIMSYIYLTEREWFSLISRLDENRKMFEQMIYAKCFSIMEKNSWILN